MAESVKNENQITIISRRNGEEKKLLIQDIDEKLIEKYKTIAIHINNHMYEADTTHDTIFKLIETKLEEDAKELTSEYLDMCIEALRSGDKIKELNKAKTTKKKKTKKSTSNKM